MTMLYPIILAGGGGTRLWPLSREHYPKQFLDLLGTATLLQQTVIRLRGFGDDERAEAGGLSVADPLIVCNEEHRFLVAEQVRQAGVRPSRIVLEPVGRNTAPALTSAALLCNQDGQDPLLLMMPSDHIVGDLAAFLRAVARGLGAADEGALVTFGIVPDRPETGYGYIRQGAAYRGITATPRTPEGGMHEIHRIDAFIEKPDARTAASYLAKGGYRWNSGIFLMRASAWLSAIEAHRPDILAACRAACYGAAEDSDFLRLDPEAFTACPSDSVDYAVMERIAGGDGQAVVVSLGAGWSDVGSWQSLWEVSEKDPDGNVVHGDVCAIDSRRNVLRSESRFLAVLGCEDLVVVETADAVLVLAKERAQDVKQIIAWLKDQGREERLYHRRVYRPWGSYEGLDEGERFQVKRIVVKPGGKLSLQMHHHRAEHWIVVCGTARVVRGDEAFLLTENQSTYIPLGVKHRLENPGTIPLEVIEVQSGHYLGEDDIVRFEDVYQRA
jgi:mannose-1-phosphate guanylyltransferase / mannose-6-phosphate isomerase